MNKEKNSQRNYFQFIISYVVILCIGVVLGVSLTFVTNGSSNHSDILVQMNIDYGDGNIQSLPVDIVTASTNLESYIYLASKRYGVPYDVRSINEVTYVEAIHNIHRTQDIPWLFTINDKVTMSDPSKYNLLDGDTILWKR